MNKYYQAIINTNGDARALSRVQVLDNIGDIVTIYADKSGTRFTDATGADVNYCEADRTGMVEFYWTAASGQTLQVLDSTGELERSIADFANNFSEPEATANVDAVLGVTASDGDLGTFTGSTIPDSSAVKPALQALETAGELTATEVDNLKPFTDLAAFKAQDVANGKATLILNEIGTNYIAVTTDESANPLAYESTSTPGTYWKPNPPILRVANFRASPGVADNSTYLQNAFNAAAILGLPLCFDAGKTYSHATGLTANGPLFVQGNGATLKATAHVAAISTTYPIELRNLIIEGAGAVYNSGGYGLKTTGVRNGSGVAPTMLDGVTLENVTFKNIGNYAAEMRYTTNIRGYGVSVENCGYSGLFFYSCSDALISNFSLDGLAGETVSGQLNAYGVTATSLTGVGVDLVRDPASVDILVDGFDIRNIPTWNALDTHGGNRITFRNGRLLNCRRGVVLTALNDRGASNCIVENVHYVNAYGVGETNSNGSYKKGEAFWDIGASATYKNTNNRFQGCSSKDAGNPSGSEGAVTIANATGGYYDIKDAQSYRVGWKFGSDCDATIRARSENPRSATVNASVAILDGDNVTLNIIDWQTGPRDAGLDTNVMNLGMVFTTGRTGVVVNVEQLDLTKAASGEFIPSSGTVIAGTINGNCRQSAEITLTGMTATVTATAIFARNNGVVNMQIPTVSGTSNTAAFTITGTPSNFRPTATRGLGVVPVLDGSNFIAAHAEIASDGTITLARDADNNTSAWTASGLKGVRSCLLTWMI